MSQSTTAVQSRYVVPSMRKVEPKVLTSEDFPSFGQPVARSAPRGVTVGTILSLIERDQMEESERTRRSLLKADLSNMTNSELVNSGWSVLPLGDLKATGLRFNESTRASLSS